MPLQIVRNDITKMECDAIVNAANSSLLGGGSVDGAIHKAAGKGLLLECMKLGRCKPGKAKITSGHKLPCKYIIHTVGPKWKDGFSGEEAILASCYYSSLELAVKNNCESIAFPLIASGTYGYPKSQALRLAVDVISSFLLHYDEILVYLVVYDKASYLISEGLFADITSFIDDNYVNAHVVLRSPEIEQHNYLSSTCSTGDSGSYGESLLFSYVEEDEDEYEDGWFDEENFIDSSTIPLEQISKQTSKFADTSSLSLEEMIKHIDESFSQMLLRKIDEKGMTDSECYKKANIDRKLFSKIRSDINYKPSKNTAIAFALSLELSLSETKDMLMKAGYALSRSNKFDIIIEYFITNRIYNVFEINEALFAFDQSLLGV